MTYRKVTASLLTRSWGEDKGQPLYLHVDDGSEHGLHIERCPDCRVLVECVWQDCPEAQFEGWACAACDAEVDNQYDPTPVEQWEVTEGSSASERHEVMVKKLRDEGLL